jgi:hypothetical protein
MSQKPLDNLAEGVCERLRQIYKVISSNLSHENDVDKSTDSTHFSQATAHRRNELDQFGNIKRTSPRPKVKRVTIETLPDREVLLLGLFSIWRTHSIFYMAAPEPSDINEWFLSIMKIWEGQNDSALKISGACSFRLAMEIAFGIPTAHPIETGLTGWLKQGLLVVSPISDILVTDESRFRWNRPENLVSVVTNLIQARGDSKEQRLWIETAHRIVELFCRNTPVGVCR